MLFDPPQNLDTTVFARIPDKFRIKGKSSLWVKVQQGGRETDCFLEGPSFDRAGNLYVVDVAYGRVFRISPDGSDIDLVTEYDGERTASRSTRTAAFLLPTTRMGSCNSIPTAARSHLT